MANGFFSENLLEHIARFVGETVTIFTTSGGQSGCGFTGIVIAANPCFVRLITDIGEAPGCALGNECGGECHRRRGEFDDDNRTLGEFDNNRRRGFNNRRCRELAEECHHRERRNLGSVVDIPVDKIAAFVHNAV